MTTPAGDNDVTARIDFDAQRPPRPRGFESQFGSQFAPGTIIAGRYRIAGILGSGGMGEVYRADDTRLDQPVALKFLPARFARDPILLGRLHEEVRLGRQVAHPNVCRVYDIVDWEGSHFVAMEYVDGEDLARLLRRIGRPAEDRAIGIARGIAAGLAAAHAKGILHRDLKPANVMIDSRGDAKIMDFGLALAAGEDDGTISGTPSYMAPEQLGGRQASVRSDLYSLGVVMFELFTGRRVQAGEEIIAPSTLVRDLDPNVDRIILSCLAYDPAQRPASAREVVHALPGGDPLAAAIAAGETPSPRLVAAAGSEGSLSPRVAWTLLASFAVLLALFLTVARERSVVAALSLELSPEVLRQRAKETLRTLGVAVTDEPIAEFKELDAYARWIREHDPRWRESWQRGLSPVQYRLQYGMDFAASLEVPITASAPGWTTVDIDPRGRISYLLATPNTPPQPKPLDWKPLLDAAGFDAASLQPATPMHTPSVPFDARAAWTGAYPGTRAPLRIEAAAWQGTPVFFRITGGWDENAPRVPMGFESPRLFLFFRVLTFAICGAAFVLAWRNLRLRRGDRQSAARVAIALLVIEAGAFTFKYPWNATALDLVSDLRHILGYSMVSAAILYLLYIALEPFARRRWPEQLIAWVRLMGGRVRDPLVGRDVLIGVICGAAHAAITTATRLMSSLWHDSMDRFAHLDVRVLGGVRRALAHVLFGATGGLKQGFLFMTILVIGTILLRKRMLAAALLFAVLASYFTLAVGNNALQIPIYLGVAALMTGVTVRFGLLAIAVMHGSFLMLFGAPPPGGPAWITPLAWLPPIVVTLLAIWAFRTSLGGQSAFAAEVFDE